MASSDRIKTLQDLLDSVKAQVEVNGKQAVRLSQLLKDSLEVSKRSQQDVSEVAAICDKVVQNGLELMLLQARIKVDLDQARSENAQQS